jgi:O-antigen/teichoic acid export membrane protein
MSASASPTDVLDTPAAGGRAIRGGAIRGVGYVVGALLSLASVPLLFRHLGVVDFGRYVTITSLIVLVGGVTDVGLASVALREYSVRAGHQRDAFMRSILGARLVLTTLGVIGATAFSALAGYGAPLVLGTALAGGGLLLTVAQTTLSVPLQAGLRVGWLTAAELLRVGLVAALIIALVLASAGIVVFLAVPIPAGLLVLALTVWLVRGTVPLRPSFAMGELVGLMRDTLPLAAATVLNVFYARIAIILTSLIATGTVTGYFGTANRVVEVAVGVPARAGQHDLPVARPRSA